MPKTCIVGGGGAGSGEHIFPACLGGHRVNNGIYCGNHNGAYGPLASKLADQLAFYNAHFKIRNTRTKQIKPVEMTDHVTGAKYEYDGDNLKPIESRMLAQNGNQVTVAVPNEPGAIERYIEEQKAKGFEVQVIGKGQPQTFHPGQLAVRQAFGGPDGLRAIGYVAQTFLAHCFPDLARNPAMKPFIDYTLKGAGDHFVWWDFEAPTNLPANVFDFGHRIIVGVDSDRGIVYGRVSLFSTLDFAMEFYHLASPDASCSVINDIDPMALKMPEDLKQCRESCAVGPVTRPTNLTDSLASAINNGKAQKQHDELMRRGMDYRRRGDVTALLAEINGVGDLAAKKRIVNEFWDTETQRILRLLGAALTCVKSQNQQSDPARHLLVRCLECATKRDEATASGLTPGADAAIKVASAALSHATGDAIDDGTLDHNRTEMFIDGGAGAGTAADAVFKAGASL